MEETIASRLKLFIDSSGITSTQFADMCGIPRPSLSQLLSGRNKKVSDIMISQIHKGFPDLSIIWLLFGEGPVRTGGVYKGGVNRSGWEMPGGTEDANIADNDEKDSLVRFDNSINTSEHSNGQNNPNVKGLTQDKSEANYTKNAQFESDIKILDLKRQIENLRENPRKVVQITIYYDDSTFETFIPKNTK